MSLLKWKDRISYHKIQFHFRLLYLLFSDTCGLSEVQCIHNCKNTGFGSGQLRTHRNKCPFSSFCSCTCPEFNLDECRKECLVEKRNPDLYAFDENGCTFCNCTCPLFVKEQCEEHCMKIGRVPEPKATDGELCDTCKCNCPERNCKAQCAGYRHFKEINMFGCEACKCICPEIDCDSQCGGQGMGIRNTDKAGCVICGGCKNLSHSMECINCELQCVKNNNKYEYTGGGLNGVNKINTSGTFCFRSCHECPSVKDL